MSLLILSAMFAVIIIGLAIYGQRKKHKLLFWALSPVVALAYVFDVLINQLLHLVLWDYQQYTITQRLKAYLQQTGWRNKLALYLQPIINALDEGHL